MKPWVHFLSSLILAVILYPAFEWKVMVIFISGFLIDIDHYLWYIYKYKKFNLFACHRYYTTDAKKNGFKNLEGILLVFHTIEFTLASIFLSFYNDFVLLFTIGLLTHYLLDLIWYYFVTKRFIANHSIISWIIKNKKSL